MEKLTRIYAEAESLHQRITQQAIYSVVDQVNLEAHKTCGIGHDTIQEAIYWLSSSLYYSSSRHATLT